MDHYTLYLDESETFTNSGQRYFAVGGVILPDSEDASVSQALDNLKMRLWPGDASATGYILHEKEISEVRKTKTKGLPHYSIFRGKHSVKQLYNDLSRILLNGKLTTMGVCISLPAMMNAYGTNTNSKLTVALQLLLENYCHFLIHNNAIGSICYESFLFIYSRRRNYNRTRVKPVYCKIVSIEIHMSIVLYICIITACIHCE